MGGRFGSAFGGGALGEPMGAFRLKGRFWLGNKTMQARLARPARLSRYFLEAVSKTTMRVISNYLLFARDS